MRMRSCWRRVLFIFFDCWLLGCYLESLSGIIFLSLVFLWHWGSADPYLLQDYSRNLWQRLSTNFTQISSHLATLWESDSSPSHWNWIIPNLLWQSWAHVSYRQHIAKNWETQPDILNLPQWFPHRSIEPSYDTWCWFCWYGWRNFFFVSWIFSFISCGWGWRYIRCRLRSLLRSPNFIFRSSFMPRQGREDLFLWFCSRRIFPCRHGG